MKNLILLPTLILSILLLACNTQRANQINPKDDIIDELVAAASDLNPATANGKIIILKDGYCEDFDCEDYFKDQTNRIQVFSVEDIFMRGIRDYMVIEKMDVESGYIDLRMSLYNDRKCR